MNSLYLIVNLASFIVPFIFSFHPRLAFHKQFKYALPAIIIAGMAFILWDMLYTHLGVWGFNPKYILGIYVYNLPLEEIMFFICIPYSCLFTSHCLQILITKDYFQKGKDTITIVLLLLLVLVGALNFNKLYTSATFFGLALLIVCVRYFIKANWLSRFYFSYLILLLPFFVVNGILTGTGPDEPVVWYNDNENLGIRALTIPIEDFFYGMFLILLSTTLFNLFSSRNKSNSETIPKP